MSGLILNFLTGSGLKILGHSVHKLFEIKRQRELAMSQIDLERLKVLQGGEDKISVWGQWTRRVLALSIVGTLCFVVIWHVVWKPDQTYTIIIDKNASFLWSLFFDVTSKTTIEISAGSLLWNFVNFVEIIAGFYFTKIGK